MALSNAMHIQSNSTHDDQPMIGKTNAKVFWIVMVASFLVLAFMVNGIKSGAIALAANAPIPVSVHADTLKGTNFHLYPGLSHADNASPVAVNQMNASITNMTITKSLSVPFIGSVNIKITAGQGNTPAQLNGMKADVSALNAGTANFQNLVMNSGGNGGFAQDASSVTLNNATINQPYMAADSVTLPNMSLSISTGK